MWALLFILLWPSPELSQTVYNRGHDLGPLAELHYYGADDFCSVQPRPLYSGELEGLPLYKIFYNELTNLVGFEFRILYNTQAPYSIPGCTPPNTPECAAPLSYNYSGYSIVITQEEKFLFEISKYNPQQTIYY
tara:strand:+ start:1733 stop:2134 length:402 start_codon:yes stop_codon:yes gene_type:complete